MPAMDQSNMNPTETVIEDQRAFQIAMELSMMGLKDPSNNFESDKDAMKRGQNMTECVPVPSSEHVAEIVGRQGCKIKALRAKTNTYIKTPVRGEEPVFVVTGRKEDVMQAKHEIMSAAEHFSQIRASRRNGSISSSSAGPPSPTTPGQITIQVRVPYRVVGLVVGPKGATIKRIQQQSQTYIVTPSREKEPVFEVTGLPDNVEMARVEIESHIAVRTGGLTDDAINDFHCNGVESGFHDMNAELVNSLYNIPTNESAFTTYNSNTLMSQDYPIFSDAKGFNNNDASPGLYEPFTIWSDGTGGSNAPMFTSGNIVRRNSASNAVSPTSTNNEHTQVMRMRSDPLSGGLSLMSSPPLHIGAFTPLSGSSMEMFSSSSGEMFSMSSGESAASGGSASSSPTGSPAGRRLRGCAVCNDSTVVAALVPCGHNVFCMECANLIMEKPESDRLCPVCQGSATQAIRIINC